MPGWDARDKTMATTISSTPGMCAEGLVTVALCLARVHDHVKRVGVVCLRLWRRAAHRANGGRVAGRGVRGKPSAASAAALSAAHTAVAAAAVAAAAVFAAAAAHAARRAELCTAAFPPRFRHDGLHAVWRRQLLRALCRRGQSVLDGRQCVRRHCPLSNLLPAAVYNWKSSQRDGREPVHARVVRIVGL